MVEDGFGEKGDGSSLKLPPDLEQIKELIRGHSSLDRVYDDVGRENIATTGALSAARVVDARRQGLRPGFGTSDSGAQARRETAIADTVEDVLRITSLGEEGRSAVEAYVRKRLTGE